jgi:hypothetical protein
VAVVVPEVVAVDDLDDVPVVVKLVVPVEVAEVAVFVGVVDSVVVTDELADIEKVLEADDVAVDVCELVAVMERELVAELVAVDDCVVDGDVTSQFRNSPFRLSSIAPLIPFAKAMHFSGV